MKYKKYIFLVIIIMTLLVGAEVSRRIHLSDYTEECYDYEQIPVVKNWSYAKEEFKYYPNDILCYDYLQNCTKINRTIINFYNSTINGECIKYHLVRRVRK